MMTTGDGYELALGGWIAARTAAWAGLFAEAPRSLCVRRASWIGFLLLSGLGLGSVASFSDDATFAQVSGWIQLLFWLVLVATYSWRIGVLFAVLIAVWWFQARADVVTAFGTLSPHHAVTHSSTSTWVSAVIGASALALYLGTRPKIWVLVVALVVAVLEWLWVSEHLWLPETHGFPDRVDVVAMSPDARFPFLSLWSGVGFAGWLSACLLRLAPRETR